jgi:hypothetical protein
MPILELLTAEIASALLATTPSPRAQTSRNNAFTHAGSCATRITTVPFSVIEKLFGIDKGAIRAHWHRDKEHRNIICIPNALRSFLKLKSMTLPIPEDLDIREYVDASPGNRRSSGNDLPESRMALLESGQP